MTFKRNLLSIALVGLGLGLNSAGCTSSKSSVLMRDEINSGWSLIKGIKGTPITIRIPTHVKLYVFEKHFLKIVGVGDAKDVEYVELPIPIRDFSQEFIHSEKVVMVDFKRPAAGASNLNVKFNGQYIDQYQQDITDETIFRVGEFLGNVGELFSASNSDSQAQPEFDNRLKEVKSVVAVGVFEIDAPDFELQVMAFLDCHLNKSHDAWSVPPHINHLKRAGLTNATNQGEVIRPNLCPFGECPPPCPAAVALPPVAPGDPLEFSLLQVPGLQFTQSAE